jgi:hypothetical protein
MAAEMLEVSAPALDAGCTFAPEAGPPSRTGWLSPTSTSSHRGTARATWWPTATSGSDRVVRGQSAPRRTALPPRVKPTANTTTAVTAPWSTDASPSGPVRSGVRVRAESIEWLVSTVAMVAMGFGLEGHASPEVMARVRTLRHRLGRQMTA